MMIDGEEGGAAAAAVTGGEGGAGAAAVTGSEGGAGAVGGGEGGANAPEWLATLPDDLKGDATLSKYQNLEAFARGHLETKKLASSKFSLPPEGATAEQMGQFYDSVGRPANAADYDISMPVLPVDAPEEARTALAEAYKPFRELAHQIGLRPEQAKALSDFELKRRTDYFAKGDAELGELRESMGRDFDLKLDAGRKVFVQIFGGDDEARQLSQEFDQKVGSARLVKAVMRLGEIAGEHGIIEDNNVEGFGEVADANAKLTELQADKSWREKFDAGDATTVAQRNRLLALAQQQALRGQRAAVS